MMIPIGSGGIYQGCDGEEEARAIEGIEDVIITAKEGQRMIPLPEGSSYLGFLFARAATPALNVLSTLAPAESALRAAHSKLHFQFATTLSVVV
jgi:L-amino acid ligase C-terminal domain 2